MFFGDQLAFRKLQIAHLEIIRSHAKELGRSLFAAKGYGRIALQSGRNGCDGRSRKLIAQRVRIRGR